VDSQVSNGNMPSTAVIIQTETLPDFAATAIDVDSRVSNGIMEDVGGHVALATDAGRINGS
jgi:hypothetical protein